MTQKKSYKKTHINQHKLNLQTQMMSYGYDPFMSEGSVKPPIFLTSTFAFKTAKDGEEFFDVMSGRKPNKEEHSGGLIYSRFNHPNLEITEDRLALLEEAEACAVFASGMGAISSVFLAFLKPHDVIVKSSPLYGGTETLISKNLANFNIQSTTFSDGLNEQEIINALEEGQKKGRVAMLFIETPANPTNDIIDFSKVKKAIDYFEKKYQQKVLTVCDNTLLGPVFQKPLLHGIDLVCYSLTKYIGGHSDLVAGAVLGKSEDIKKIKSTRSAYGMQLDPNSSWMISRSLETLFLRMKHAEQSALKIADWLYSNPYCKVEIYHPKYIKNDEYQKAFQSQATGYGSTFAFVIEGDRQKAFRFIDALTIFKSAVSLGGSESLICHPASTTHSGVPMDLRKKYKISEGLIRISIGLEDPNDLIADLMTGLKSL